MSVLLFLLLLLGCPLAMFLMMRGGRGHGGHGRATSASGSDDERLSVRELRRRRGELDRLTEGRERVEVPAAPEAKSRRAT